MNKSHIKTYLIECQETKFIKIGRSENPRERLASLQCGSATKLKLIHVIDANIEQLLHSEFVNKRLHGEWFSISAEEILSYVDSIQLLPYQVSGAEVIKRKVDMSSTMSEVFFEKESDIAKNELGEYIDSIGRCRDYTKPFYDHDRFTNIKLRKEYNMINMIVFGMPEESLRLILHVNDYDDLGPSLPPNHFEAIRQLQRANTVYIEDGIDFQVRKQKLTDLFNRKHKQKLIDEIHLLEA